jgi:hypothetical protein
MTSTVELVSPDIIDNESSNILQFDTISSRYYLTKNINRNLKAIGNDIIIDGFETVYSEDVNNFYFTISQGRAVCDLSLIESNINVYLDINKNLFESTADLLIFLNYKYNEQEYSTAKLKLYYIIENSIYPNDFNLDFDKILISKFTLNNGTLIQSDISFNTNEVYTILNKNFEIYPLSNLFKTQLKYIDKISFLYNYLN